MGWCAPTTVSPRLLGRSQSSWARWKVWERLETLFLSIINYNITLLTNFLSEVTNFSLKNQEYPISDAAPSESHRVGRAPSEEFARRTRMHMFDAIAAKHVPNACNTSYLKTQKVASSSKQIKVLCGTKMSPDPPKFSDIRDTAFLGSQPGANWPSWEIH